MKKLMPYIPKVVSYFFILLFCYAAISKALDFENFQVQIGQSPLLSAYAGFVSFAVIALEVIIVLLLIFPRSNLLGLYTSTALMSAFTIYIFLILNYSEFVPCSCGGILEKMGWTEHLVFNIFCVLFGCVSVWILGKGINHSKRKTSFLLIISNFTACLSILFLFLQSEHIIKKENNFTRRFLIHPLIEKQNIILDNDTYYFAGQECRTLYFGNRKYPLSVTEMDTTLLKSQTSYIQPDQKKLNFKNISLSVKDLNYYIYDGTVPIIFKGQLGNNTAKTISFQDAYFNSLIVQDSSTYAIRTQSAATKNFTLATLHLNSLSKLKMHDRILEKQADGVFDLDGILLRDKAENELIYIYAYRNQFIVMNDEMEIKHRLNTIDTVKNAQIKSVQLSDGSHKMNQPPLKVNSHSFAYRGLLFNHSALMGKNESKSAWKKADIIDVYRTDEQVYIGSFYIYRKMGRKLSDLYVVDNSLYVLQDNLLTKYNISKQITKYFRKGEAEKPYQE